MPVTRCPHCILPLLPNEAAGAACPACDAPLPHAPPPVLQTAPSTLLHPPTRHSFATGLAAATLLGLVAAALGAWVAWPTPGDPPDRPPTARVDRSQAPTTPPPGANADLLRARAEATGLAKKLAATEMALRDAHVRLQASQEKAGLDRALAVRATARAEEAEKKGVAMALALDTEKQKARAAADRPVAMRPPPPRLVGKKTLTLDLPNGEYTVPALGNEARITLAGRVKRLKVTSADGDAVLDASRLQAGEVVVLGTINGDSTVKVSAPGGRVSIRDINGKADVDVKAPGGNVTIQELNGEARTSVLGKEVTFANSINGTTETAVVITRDGRLRFKELLGRARLHWKKEKPLDPDPKVERGRLSPAAELRRIS